MFQNVLKFFKGLFGFVEAAAPVAAEVGRVTGNKDVTQAAELAELSAKAADAGLDGAVKNASK